MNWPLDQNLLLVTDLFSSKVYQKQTSKTTPEAVRSGWGCFCEAAKEHGIYIDTCAEDIDLSKYGVGHANCIDQHRFERIGNYKLNIERDKNQRTACSCVSSIEIGAYITYRNGCVYCYANFNQTLVNDCCGKHDPSSPLLHGEITAEDIIKPREMKSFRNGQMSLFG